MLNKENYVPWSSRLLRYAKSRPNGKLIHNSVINGSYVRRMIPEPGDPNCEVPVNETFHVQIDDELTEKELKQIEADDQAIQTILLGLPEDIYAAVDSCETTQEIWIRVQQMMKGFDIGIQEKKTKLFNEWERFTSTDGESYESYYHHFLKLMNDFKKNKHFPKKIASNIKFLNNLQPEWSRHVTIVHQTKVLLTTYYTQLYDFLKYNQKEMVGDNGRNHFRQYVRQNVRNQNGYNAIQNVKNQVVQDAVQNLRVQNVGNQNGLIVVLGIVNQNPDGNGNLVAARAEGNVTRNTCNQIRCYNCRGLGHFARNCTRASTSGTQTNKSPVYDSNGLAEVHNNDNCYDNEIFNMFTQEEQYIELLEPIPKPHQVPQNANNVIYEVSSVEQSWETVEQHTENVEETRVLYESLYNNLAIEVEKVNTINRKLRDTNAELTTELARYKNQEKCFEISQEIYDKLERYLNKQLSMEKSIVSALLKEKKKLKSDFKIREYELLDKQIQLENKIKELNNILVKMGQSIQTMHMISPKPDSFYHIEQKMALGYQNSFYLKQAQQKQQSLYNGKVLLEKHDPPVVYDSKETLQLAQGSRLKMKQLNKEIKLANSTKINHLSWVFVSQTAKSCEELYFSNTSKTDNVSKPISIPNEDFSDDTTPSVARKFLNEVKSIIVTLQRVVKHRMTLDTHNWSSSAHQDLHKIVKDEIFSIVNQVDARVLNFEIQFLKEAAKFVQDFKSLAKEADESLAKHKALELEIERLLKEVVSQDIMSVVQHNSVVSAAKLPILNPNEIDLWKIRIEQYFLMTNYSLWEVILNGDSPVPTRIIEGVSQPVAPTTAKQRLARKNELEACGTLLMALPDKHQLKFNSHKDAKTLMQAIENSEGLDQIHDRLQKLVSQLEIHGVSLSQEDVNLNLKIYETKVKQSSSSSTATQNLAFVSSTSTDSTTDSVSTTASVSAACVKLSASPLPNVDSLSKNLGSNGTSSMGFDMFKVECYNYHRKGHFARECRSPMDQRRPDTAEPQRRTVPVFTKAMFDCENYYSPKSDCESWPPSNLYDRFQPSGGYHVVPPPYTVTFMPPKPDLVFNTAPIPVETDQLAFNVHLSPTKTKQDFPTSNGSGKRRNRNACFVCKSVDHLIKHCDYHSKRMAQPTPRNYANRGHQKQYVPLPHTKPQKHRVPPTVLTQSKLVSNTAVRPVSAALPNIFVTRPRHVNQVVTKSKSPIRWHLTRNPSSRTSNSPPRFNAVQVPVVSAAQGKQGTWGNPQLALQDKGVIDSRCLRHMTGNMSYLFDFEELNGGYVIFGGNLKGGKITGKGKIKTDKLDFDNVYFIKELKFNLFSVSQMCDKKNSVLFTNTECLVLSSDFK
nr:ribonuclease H-like domain-containing protein [Tanacetum cinerariifolium]